MKHLLVVCLIASAIFTSINTSHAKPFAIRGIKGLWWEGSAKYKDIMKWMPEHHFNFLMFCYSSFPGSGMKWREPYTEAEMRDFKEISDYCRSHGIDLCLSVNPGIWSNPPLSHSSDSDYKLLYDKLAGVHKLGINRFALCLDDINRGLTPEDKERFKTLEAAQSHLINRLFADLRKLDPKIKLIFCPSAYTTEDAQRNLEYITFIGKHIDKAVMMFWTGPTVCSVSISEEDAGEFARLIGRKPLIWDNYPVNDYCSWKPLMAPVRNRGKHLAEHALGLMSNPMKQSEASKIPLATIGEYLWDPENYDPARSLDKAVTSYAPAKDVKTLRKLLDIYGRGWLGDPGYTSKNIIKDPEAAGKRLAQLQAVLDGLAESPKLAKLRADVAPDMESEMKQLKLRVERAKNGPGNVLFGFDMEGGAAEIFGTTQHGKDGVNYVYAKPTGRDRMTGVVTLKDLTAENRKITLTAMDDDFPEPCKIEIRINGTGIFSGPSGFPNNSWEQRTIDIPREILKAGKNKLEIVNAEPSGTLGMPPWFMVAEVRVE